MREVRTKNAEKSRRHAVESTGDYRARTDTNMDMLRVRGFSGSRLGGRRDVRAWKEGVCGVATHWGRGGDFFYFVTACNIARLPVVRCQLLHACACARVGRRWRSAAVTEELTIDHGLDRCLFNRRTDDGRRRTQVNSPKAAVYTGVRMLEKFRGVPNSLTMQFRISERTPSTCLWIIARSGRRSVRILDQETRGTTDR